MTNYAIIQRNQQTDFKRGLLLLHNKQVKDGGLVVVPPIFLNFEISFVAKYANQGYNKLNSCKLTKFAETPDNEEVKLKCPRIFLKCWLQTVVRLR